MFAIVVFVIAFGIDVVIVVIVVEVVGGSVMGIVVIVC